MGTASGYGATTLSIMTLGIALKNATLSIQHLIPVMLSYAECHK